MKKDNNASVVAKKSESVVKIPSRTNANKIILFSGELDPNCYELRTIPDYTLVYAGVVSDVIVAFPWMDDSNIVLIVQPGQPQVAGYTTTKQVPRFNLGISGATTVEVLRPANVVGHWIASIRYTQNGQDYETSRLAKDDKVKFKIQNDDRTKDQSIKILQVIALPSMLVEKITIADVRRYKSNS